MRILLPPSETKRSGGVGMFDPASLSFDEQLRAPRERVREALVQLSGDEDLAVKALKLGKKNRDERELNLVLDSSGVRPAIERYTGVLYDALDVPSLEPDARAWVDGHVYVQSALFGLVRACDPIPAYRLSAGSRLPALAAPLKRVWSEAHTSIRPEQWRRDDLVLDLRSKDYAALSEVPGAVRLHVVQRTEAGDMRALNHFNKAAKGDLVRRLARSCAGGIVDVDGLLAWAAEEGVELVEHNGLTLVTRLGVPDAG